MLDLLGLPGTIGKSGKRRRFRFQQYTGAAGVTGPR
jgi:hypothetical protein